MYFLLLYSYSSLLLVLNLRNVLYCLNSWASSKSFPIPQESTISRSSQKKLCLKTHLNDEEKLEKLPKRETGCEGNSMKQLQKNICLRLSIFPLVFIKESLLLFFYGLDPDKSELLASKQTSFGQNKLFPELTAFAFIAVVLFWVLSLVGGRLSCVTSISPVKQRWASFFKLHVAFFLSFFLNVRRFPDTPDFLPHVKQLVYASGII